ncbi:MAG: hypothetical protein RKR03_21035, partial [Candidatus Competibacter sp.]|nr:hypothetical protein [Candidatus Competibacter sp.]MDS4069690.1 hypothetical protein [Candidatus Competibacter sp.]
MEFEFFGDAPPEEKLGLLPGSLPHGAISYNPTRRASTFRATHDGAELDLPTLITSFLKIPAQAPSSRHHLQPRRLREILLALLRPP